MVQTMPIPTELISYIERVNTAFPKIEEQIKPNAKGVIEAMIELGMIKPEDV